MIDTHRLTVPRTARLATVGPLDGDVVETWFALHGYGQMAARFARRFTPLDDGRHLVVLPEGLNRYYVDHRKGVVGATWMTREDREEEIQDYVRYLDAVAAWLPAPAAAAPRTVLGFSQGSATAWRWLTFGTERPPQRLVIWGGEIPPDLDLTVAASRLAGTEIVLVAGTEDIVCPPAKLRQYADRLAAAGLPATTRTFAGGHDIDQDLLTQLAR